RSGRRCDRTDEGGQDEDRGGTEGHHEDYPARKLGAGAVGFWVLALEHAVLKGKARAAGHPRTRAATTRGEERPPATNPCRRQRDVAAGGSGIGVLGFARQPWGHRTCHGLAQVRRPASLMNPLTRGDLSE